MTRRTATTRRHATENEALAGLLGIWNRHRTHGFAPNLRGPGASALMLATRRGWLWNSGNATFLTLAGVQALGEFLGRDLIAEQAALDAQECADLCDRAKPGALAAHLSAHRRANADGVGRGGRVMEAAE